MTRPSAPAEVLKESVALPQQKAVPVMPLPRWGDLSVEAQDAFERMAESVPELRAVEDVVLDGWLAELSGKALDALPRYAALEHRLAPFMAARTPNEVFHPRTPGEARLAPAARLTLERALRADASNFAAALHDVHAGACAGLEGFRSAPIRSLPDRQGTYVVFPPADEISPGLARLHAFLREELADHRVFASTVAMVSLGNLHPFRDGNGRTSRIVFNALLHREQRPVAYVPLHELGRVSRGSLLVAMRLAQYRGEWQPIAYFLRQCICLVSALGRPCRSTSVDDLA